MATNIYLSKRFEKEINRLPRIIQEAIFLWVGYVEERGVEQVRREIRGYRDKALRGKREGQRSIRLNRGYRLFYSTDGNGEITILEVNKHEY